MINQEQNQLTIALAWSLAWGKDYQPQFEFSKLQSKLQQLRKGIQNQTAIPSPISSAVNLVKELQAIPHHYQPENLIAIRDQYPDLWKEETPIGLVYGGATKIKNYVLASANLTEIRGASAILDRINLVDLPALFKYQEEINAVQNLASPELLQALIPEMIIYSTGGNILALCPAAYVDELANVIEEHYTNETLTANSCAVGDTFRLLEFQFGLLQSPFENTLWLDWYRQNADDPIMESYYGKVNEEKDINNNFYNRKSFNELAGKLANLFNQRRSGNLSKNRPNRCYPPQLETHPYLVRDENEGTSAITQVNTLASEPYFSEPLARKYIMGQQTKREGTNQKWYHELGLDWQPKTVESWVKRFENFLEEEGDYFQSYYKDYDPNQVTEARNLEEVANASNDFISFIYADGNNMGGYIQTIRTPQDYQQFSADIFEATEKSVYHALAQNLNPHRLQNIKKEESQFRNQKLVHPFEIITIGGDDVLLIVPASKAIAIAKALGEMFEKILLEKDRYQVKPDSNSRYAQRYCPENSPLSQCQLSMSIGLLTLNYKTPIYYAEKLANQLLKSAKKRAKELKQKYNYYGGTVDILTLKSVTMINSNIQEFREQALQLKSKKLYLYATPYTFYELGGLLETVKAFQEVEFPRSQLYQIRSFLKQGKKTAILNYRYFAVRLSNDKRQFLKKNFEEAWCQAKTNDGNLAPWMSDQHEAIYETIWNDIIDLYPFIENSKMNSQNNDLSRTITKHSD